MIFWQHHPFTEPVPQGFLIIIEGKRSKTWKKYKTFVIKMIKLVNY